MQHMSNRKCLKRHIPLLLSCLLSLTSLSSPAMSQEPPKGPKPIPESKDAPNASRARPIPVTDFRILWNGTVILVLRAESNMPKPGLPDPTINAADLRYFYMPLFLFKRDKGELQIKLDEKTGEIKIPIVFDDKAVPQFIRNYLVDQKLIPASTTPGQIQVVAASTWYVETPPGYEPYVKFGPYPNFQFPNMGELYTTLRLDNAKKFVNDLKLGLVLHPTVVFNGYGYKDISLVITADDILASDVLRKIVGNGGEGKVSRNQVARIAKEACIRRDVFVTTEYHDSDFNELVAELAKQFLTKEAKLTPNWDKVEASLKELGIDPNDIKADFVEASKYTENKEAREQLLNDVNKSFGVGANASYGIFAASASFKHDVNEKIAKEVFNKWGINVEFMGGKFIPKTVDVYQMSKAKIHQLGSIAVGKRKKIESNGVLTTSVHTNNNVLNINTQPAFEQRLEELAQKQREMKELFDTLKNTDIKKLNEQVLKIDRLDIWVTSSKANNMPTSNPIPNTHGNYTFVHGVAGLEAVNNAMLKKNTMTVMDKGGKEPYKCDGRILEVLVIPTGAFQTLKHIPNVTVVPDKNNPGQLLITGLTTGDNEGGQASVNFRIVVISTQK